MTESSYTELELNLTEEEQDKYVDLYCRLNLGNCSYTLYEDVKKSHDIREALYNAVLNQMINDALVQEVKRLSQLEQGGDVGC